MTDDIHVSILSDTRDDHTLLTLIAQGDQDSLRVLFERYRSRLWSFLFRQLNQEYTWTEDIIQETFVAIWESAKLFRGESSVSTWIFHIAHHLSANAVRYHSRHQAMDTPIQSFSDRDGELLPQNKHWVTNTIETSILDRITIDAAMNALSSKLHIVAHLVLHQHFTLDETAEILNIPAGTVKSRLRLARDELVRYLQSDSKKEAVHEQPPSLPIDL